MPEQKQSRRIMNSIDFSPLSLFPVPAGSALIFHLFFSSVSLSLSLTYYHD